MKRSTFIKRGSLLSIPMLINNIPLYANPDTGDSFLNFLAKSMYGCGKVLVIIQMNGGNDGLNTVIPLSEYARLDAARHDLMIPQNSVLTLNNNVTTGLHPSLSHIKNLYDDGKVVIIQGVSYPNPNFSHFRATDIWFSASDSNVTLETGWLGRSLDTQYPNYPATYPNVTMPDPLAIQIGSTMPFSLQGPSVNMGYNVTDPNALLNVINETPDPAPNTDYGHELTFLRLMKDQSNAYRVRIQEAYALQTTQSPLYPVPPAPTNALANQLKIVARLIGGGLKTPIYIVNHPNSHDTHVDQVVAGNTVTGTHANILNTLSVAINAFQDDVSRMGVGPKVTGMTFSEFGRRVIQNASTGTDHGVGAPVIVFGEAVKAGMIGIAPPIPTTSNGNTQVGMQFDFRQIYSTMMQDWFCMTPAETLAVLGANFTKLPIFNTAVLPFEDITLNGQYYNGETRLNFKVEDNTHYEKFIIQFSTDGTQFTDIQTITRVSTADIENYQYSQVVRGIKLFYRIRGVLMGAGQRKDSNIVMLRTNDRQQLITVYPNPVIDHQLNVKFFELPTEEIEINIYDLLGTRLYYNRVAPSGRVIQFRVPQIFSKSQHYILEVKSGSEVAREQLLFL